MRLSSFGVIFLICTAGAHAGDSASITGSTHKFRISFHDPRGGADEFITVSNIDPEVPSAPMVSFSSQCVATARKIQCRRGGVTPLAGATYKVTNDGSPVCGGLWEPRFTCVRGCTRDTPRYLQINPYEC